jgi:pimeloyl-ACP methyl ester carboxylesterase
MKKILIVLFVFISINTFAQQIGHTTITFADATRTGGFGSGGGAGRQIQTEIYYNATNAGTDVPLSLVASKPAGLIVFGHGFAMGWDSYSWLWDSLTKMGYVIALPRTEGGIFSTPSHPDFGADLKFVVAKMIAQNTLSTSIFYNKLNNKIAIGGHSMGGGCSFLAADNNTNFDCLFNLAAAETNTASAITSAGNISKPTLVIAGGADCVAPTAANAKSMYDKIPISVCKYYININDALHCQFNDLNLTCSAGQLSCPTSTLTRNQQLSIVLRHLKPFLDYYILNDATAKTTFDANFTNATDVIKEQSCSPLGNGILSVNLPPTFWPNPASIRLNFENTREVKIYNISGKLVKQKIFGIANTLDISTLPSGIYFIELHNNNKVVREKLVVQ